ncbi:MAG: hypothetical protein NZ455_07800 [Bacteroidia bacterium]|nr:hypothetical protein [Bacteroidia bacterium]
MGVSLRCARVGVLRAALSLRCYANATHCSRTLRMPHAHSILMFYLVFIYTFALPSLILTNIYKVKIFYLTFNYRLFYLV